MAHAPERLPITINNTSYFVEASGYQRTTVPVLREQRDTSDEPGEQQLNTQMWIRSQTDWSYGSGQEYLDNSDSDRRRFHRSEGIDVWTKGQVSLLPIMESKNGAESFTNVIMKVFKSNGTDYMYVASGHDLYWSSDFANETPTWTQMGDPSSGSADNIADITSDGAKVYISYGTRYATEIAIGAAAGTAPANFTNKNVTLFRVVGSRLIEMSGDEINELDSTGSPITGSLNFTLPLDGVWVDACTGPKGVYAACNTDEIGTIYFISTDEDGKLNQPAQVADLPRGETINAMESYGGLLLLATSHGFRLATMQEGGSVVYGPEIVSEGGIYSITADDKFAWFGEAGGLTYRADLSRFTEPLVPAYAQDVASVGSTPGNVTWMARVDHKTYFVDAANGVQGDAASGNLVSSGTLTVGGIRWNSQFEKVLRQIEVRSSPTLAISTDTPFDSSSTYDDANLVFDGLLSPVSGTIKAKVQTGVGLDLSELTLTDRVPSTLDYSRSDKYTLTLTLERDGTTLTAGPVLQSWQVQAFPSPTRIDEIVLPLVLKKRVASSRGHGAAVQQDPKALYDALRTLMVNKSVVTYQEGNYSDQVVVDQLQFTPEQLSADADWWEGTCVVRLLTVP
jgi:hypothetical protein